MKFLYFIPILFVFFFGIAFGILNIGDSLPINENNKVEHINENIVDLEIPIKKPSQNILILGIDSKKDEHSRSDVIILFNMKEDAVNLVSIPRDTQISLKDKGKVKINAAYVYGGIELSKSTIENLLDIEIDNYIVLNFNAIKKGVDAIGGFTVTIPKDIKIYDPDSRKRITLKKGTHKLNGIQTLSYLRYRSDGKGDLARIDRQQQFIKDLQQNFLKLDNIPLIPRAYAAVHEDIETDMNSSHIASFFINGYHLREKFQYYTLDGNAKTIDGISYLIHSEDSLNEIKKILKD
ncbi:MAG: LCP family protein [Firmicutes bacterium]|nr:LCP family protein [Bacillota bacterium]